MEKITETPIEVVAQVSRLVTLIIDRITGDRVEVPLMVAAAAKHALALHGIESQVMYGPAAWIEILADNSVIWAGCWGDHYSFWVATQYGEVVDLNVSVAARKPSHQIPSQVAVLSPPMLWSKDVPAFYRYQPQGIAELELTSDHDKKQFEWVTQELTEKCGPKFLKSADLEEFPNEAILVPGRRVLDDSKTSFKLFDRVMSVRGVPRPPI